SGKLMVAVFVLKSSLYVELSSTAITPTGLGLVPVICAFQALTAVANVLNTVLGTALSSWLTATCQGAALLKGDGLLEPDSQAERSYGPAPRFPLKPYT